MKRFCDVCGKDVDTEIVNKKETYTVCGENVDVDAKVLVCSICGNELFSEDLDNETLVLAYNEYRRRHKLLLPGEIKEIRQQYGLSQRGLARILNWGDKTIARYENGSIQDKAHNSLLLLLRDPKNMRKYLTENEVSLSQSKLKKLMDTLDKLEKNSDQDFSDMVINTYFKRKPSEDNGYKIFDYDKFRAMVLFFANKAVRPLKTKLMKLLNYSDMIFFKENGISISGIRYIHLPYGPVPDNFDILLGLLEADRVAHIEVFFSGGYEMHQVVPEEGMPQGVLTADELNVMERVYHKFANFGSVEISDYSHKEKGYRSTKTGQVISYAYARDIEFD